MTEVQSTGAPAPRQDRHLIFIKLGNLLFIQSVDHVAVAPEVFQLLHDHLSYDHREFLYGAAARDPVTGRKRRVEVTEKRLYAKDAQGRLYTGLGFARRCHSVLKAAGYAVSYYDWDQEVEKTQPHVRPARYEEHWDNITRHFDYRPKQFECLQAIAKNRNGVVHAVTAFGKRIAIVMTCLLYPRAKIHIIIRPVPLVMQMVEELTRVLPNIGQVGGGVRRFGDRITVFTRDSLHHSDFDADFVLGDECFVGGTEVDSLGGKRRIELVRPGDKVYNSIGLGTVEEVICRTATELYTLEFSDGRSVTVTGGHPFFTSEGWVEARRLDKGSIAYSPEGVRLLWEGVSSLETGARVGKGRRKVRTGLGEADRLLAILCEEVVESDEQLSGKGEGGSKIAGDKAQTDKARRERAIAALAAIGTSSRVGRGLGVGIAGSNEAAARQRVSDLLQDRSGPRREEDSDRSERPHSRFASAAREGRQEDEVSGRVRVVSVSRVESESATPVFNLRVSGHPSYFANGRLVHNCHQLVTDEAAPLLSSYQRSRNFAFTATPTGRSDGSDPRLEHTFGPTIFYLSYPEAVSLGLVVPIRVEWRDVILDRNPAFEKEDIDRQRYGIWHNDARNDLIADDVVEVVPKDEQLLVLTDTVFHAVELYRRIRGRREREPVLVYDKIEAKRFRDYQTAGDLPPDLQLMTAERKEQYRKMFEAGEIDAIATKTWEVGIDPIHLQYLFIAASFSSEIKAQQAPGRASRINVASGKEVGIVRDYRDQFDSGFHAAARARFRVYESLGWEQVLDTGNGFTPL